MKKTAEKKSSAKPRAKTTSKKSKSTAKPKQKPEPLADGEVIRGYSKEEYDTFIKKLNGRPTKYDPSMCDQVIAWGAQGKSRTWIAAEMMLTRQTLNNWANENKEFFDALERAKFLEQQFWEDEGYSGMRTSGFGQAIWSRNMAARFPTEWRESRQIDHGVTDSFADLLKELEGTPRIPGSEDDGDGA